MKSQLNEKWPGIKQSQKLSAFMCAIFLYFVDSYFLKFFLKNDVDPTTYNEQNLTRTET